MKKHLFLLIGTLLVSCANNPISSMSNSSSLEGSSISSTNSEASSVLSSSIELDSSSSIYSSSGSSIESSSSSIISSSSTSSNVSSGSISTPISSATSSTTTYNPDGSVKLEAPLNSNNKIDITEWQNFGLIDSLPDNFRYIYGNNFVQPDFYQSEGGGLKFNKNENAKKGFQTPMFSSFLKMEVRLMINTMNNSSSKVNDSNPVLTIYGFDQNGVLKETAYVENFDKSQEGKELKFYLRNIEISYLEIRATNLPYKGSQVYNFGINKFSIKGWPYAD